MAYILKLNRTPVKEVGLVTTHYYSMPYPYVSIDEHVDESSTCLDCTGNIDPDDMQWEGYAEATFYLSPITDQTPNGSTDIWPVLWYKTEFVDLDGQVYPGESWTLVNLDSSMSTYNVSFYGMESYYSPGEPMPCRLFFAVAFPGHFYGEKFYSSEIFQVDFTPHYYKDCKNDTCEDWERQGYSSYDECRCSRCAECW